MSEDETVVEHDVSAVTQQPEDTSDVRLVTSDPPAPEPDPDAGPAPIISDGNCPLLGIAAPPTRVTEKVGEEIVVHKEAGVQLDRPTPCPTCGKKFEAHSLPLDIYGVRDCAVAMSYKNNPNYRKFFEVVHSDPAAAKAEADKLGEPGKLLWSVYGSKHEPEQQPASDQPA